MKRLSRLLYRWVPHYCAPPRWMGYTIRSVARQETLFIISPFNLIAAVLLWIDWKLRDASFVEHEINRRVADRLREDLAWQDYQRRSQWPNVDGDGRREPAPPRQ